MEYPFSNKCGRDLISIPKGATRKGEFLNVDNMTQLYDLFMERNYPEQWSCDVTPNVHFSIGLFLAQCLCNGFNLADEAFLTYDDYSFATNLRNAGVDMQYISESMGHSTQKTATQLYLASYLLHTISVAVELLRKYLWTVTSIT